MRLRVTCWPEPLKRRRFRWNCNGETRIGSRHATRIFCMIAALAVCGGIVMAQEYCADRRRPRQRRRVYKRIAGRSAAAA